MNSGKYLYKITSNKKLSIPKKVNVRIIEVDNDIVRGDII